MSLVRFTGGNHPQQVSKRGAKDEIDDRATTPEMFAALSARFGGFDLDVAAAAHNTKCERFFTRDDDGLNREWGGSVWCNPPYSAIGPWVAKAWLEFWAGRVERVVMLLPANRTEQQWWQLHVEPYRDRPQTGLRTEFIAGRVRFLRKGQTVIDPNERPPFGSVLLIWEVSHV